ncbi:MAG: hypothetical protein Q9166_004811 [cf. Caloplaca sp. 2 TL-2023]
MTPDYSQDPLDPQNKQTPYFAHPHGRQTQQLYPTMAQAHNQQNLFPPSYQVHQHDMADMAMGNSVGALNQQALVNLPPPLPYPNPGTLMTTPSPAKPPSSYLVPTSPVATSTSPPPKEQKPSSQTASTQTYNSGTNSSSSPGTTSAPPKKKFPCPHATRFSCSDTFTTSGHAARHGKKHTGEKSVVCPTCNKAFTRKDNMKQHERTHKNHPLTRHPVDDVTSHATARPQRDSRSRSPSMPDSTPSATTENSDFNFATTPLMHRGEPEMVFQSTGRRGRANGRVSTGSGRSEEDGEGESPGLDALAAAAIMG